MKSSSVFVVVLLVFAGVGAALTSGGGFSDAANARVAAGSAAVVGTISEGESVDLAAFAQTEGRTVFFFTKPWCGGCWRLAPRVEDAVHAASGTTLRVVDIREWESDVARQHGINATPDLILYEDGRQAGRGIAQVLSLIEP